jgi:hypothetical protein
VSRDKERHAAYNRAWEEANRARGAVARRARRKANKERHAAYHRTWRRKYRKSQKSPRYVLAAALRKALKRFPTDNPATIEDLLVMWDRQSGKCALLGIPLTWGGGDGKPLPTSVSIDRINRRQGYGADNIRLVCFWANTTRGSGSDLEFYRRLLIGWLDKKSSGMLKIVGL